MRVLHVIPSISSQSGGPSQAIFPMCRALRARGVELVLATTDAGLSSDTKNGSPPLGEVTQYKDQSTIFFPSQLGAGFKYSRPFAVWLDENVSKYDIVHIHAVFNHACIAAARSCRRHNVPYIVRPLGTLDPWSMKQKALRKRLFWTGGVKSMLDSAAAVHYTATAEKEGTEGSLGLNHGVVVPLGVELPSGTQQPRNALKRKLPELGDRSYLLVLSRLLPTKGIDVLLEAFLSLMKRKAFSSWCLVLAGEGPEDYVRRLKQRVAAEGASEQVLFPGWLDGQEKDATLGNASLLVLPSYHENFGLCVIEALAHQVPVVVSPQVNLASEIDAAGAGWVVAIEKEALETVLESALSSEEERRRRGAAGRTLAARFEWALVGEKLTSLYASILQVDQAPLVASFNV